MRTNPIPRGAGLQGATMIIFPANAVYKAVRLICNANFAARVSLSVTGTQYKLPHFNCLLWRTVFSRYYSYYIYPFEDIPHKKGGNYGKCRSCFDKRVFAKREVLAGRAKVENECEAKRGGKKPREIN